MKKIYLATDHAGFDLKEKLKSFLELDGGKVDVEDCGAFFKNNNDDYPEFIFKAAEKVSGDVNSECVKDSLAIVFGGSGQGEAMMANRLDGVRATTYYSDNKEILRLSKEHNNANILSIGARFFGTKKKEEKLFNDILYWINLEFSEEERHKRRTEKIDIISREFYGLKTNTDNSDKIRSSKKYIDYLKSIFA